MNREGLRYPQEFVRHKMLDAVGDLAWPASRCSGAYRSVRGGHRLNSLVLQALLADHDGLDHGAGAAGARGAAAARASAPHRRRWRVSRSRDFGCCAAARRADGHAWLIGATCFGERGPRGQTSNIIMWLCSEWGRFACRGIADFAVRRVVC